MRIHIVQNYRGVICIGTYEQIFYKHINAENEILTHIHTKTIQYMYVACSL